MKRQQKSAAAAAGGLLIDPNAKPVLDAGQGAIQSPSHAQRILTERKYRSGPAPPPQSPGLVVAKLGSLQQSPTAVHSPKAASEEASSVLTSSVDETSGAGEMVEVGPANEAAPALRGVFTDGGGEGMRGVLVCLSGAKGGFTGPCRDASKRGLYHRLASRLPGEGIGTLQVDYRLKGVLQQAIRSLLTRVGVGSWQGRDTGMRTWTMPWRRSTGSGGTTPGHQSQSWAT